MPLDAAAAEAAAEELFRARRDFARIEALPDDRRPATAEDGYAVQARVVDKLLAHGGGRRVGYKIGATNPGAREMLGAAEAFSGALISDFCHESPAAIRAADFHVIVLEPEIAVRMGRDLPASGAPYTPESAFAAVGAVAPAIEVVTSPFPVWNEAGIGCIIGDNGANGCWVRGDFVEDFAGIDLPGLAVALSVDGEVAREGAGRNVDGGPAVVLAWLANALAARGGGLRAGDLVTTGSATQPLPVAGGAAVADFGPLGRCLLTIG